VDPRVRRITVRDLLRMASGFAVDESLERAWHDSPHWVRFTLQRRLAHPPGQVFRYDTQAVHLLSAILATATKTDTEEFANRRLFGPLGIDRPAWPADPQGNPNGGFGLMLNLRDMAKLGQLYLDQGRWNGRQLIPADYVQASTRPQGQAGLPLKEDEGISYGYLWWVTRSKGHPAYFAQGYGGQFVYVVPALGLVVAIASTQDGEHIENRRIVARFVVPAVRAGG
ncbi:MAG TPA: serine hydrolase, partial [Cryptosporangiaceae bacterium]|nr:serine hydrolase [Cryptosporangiaceae bacterium]